MTEEQTVKFYSASFLAWREENGQKTLRVKPGVVLAFSEDDAHRDGLEGALAVLPASEGWTEHQVLLAEIPRGLDLGHFRVSWDAKKTS